MSLKDFIVNHKNDIAVFGGLGSFGCAIASAIEETPRAIERVRENAKELEYLKFERSEALKKAKEDSNYIVAPEDVYRKTILKQRLAGAGKVMMSYRKTFIFTALGTAGVVYGYGSEKSEHAKVIEKLSVTTAALAATSAKFDNYRANVIADQGIGKDQDYYYGTKPEVVNETYVDDDGEEKTGSVSIRYLDTSLQDCPFVDPYTFVIPGDSILARNYSPYQLTHVLKCKMDAYQSQLDANGLYLDMQTILDELGISPATMYSKIDANVAKNVGWIKVGANGEYNDFATDGKYLSRDKRSAGPTEIRFAEYDKDGDPVINRDPETGDYYITLNCVNIAGMIPTPEKLNQIKEGKSDMLLKAIENNPDIEK